MRNQLPQFMYLKDKVNDDTRILATLIACHCLNYNTMLTTVFTFIPMFLISYYTLLMYTVNYWWDPYGHKPFANDNERNNYIASQLVYFVLNLTMMLSKHYLA